MSDEILRSLQNQTRQLESELSVLRSQMGSGGIIRPAEFGRREWLLRGKHDWHCWRWWCWGVLSFNPWINGESNQAGLVMYCDFAANDSQWKCTLCGRVMRKRNDRSPVATCSGPVPVAFDTDLAELGVEVSDDEHRKSLWAQWREAVKRWKDAGKPIRHPDAVDACLSICKACEHYGIRLTVPYCQACGCNLKTPGLGSLSKAKMKTEKCPEGKWE